jgi:hypothetical protein
LFIRNLIFHYFQYHLLKPTASFKNWMSNLIDNVQRFYQSSINRFYQYIDLKMKYDITEVLSLILNTVWISIKYQSFLSIYWFKNEIRQYWGIIINSQYSLNIKVLFYEKTQDYIKSSSFMVEKLLDSFI